MDATRGSGSRPEAAPAPASAHEIDLSSEWEGMTDAPAETVMPTQSANEVADEVKFYIRQSMWTEAGQALTKLEGAASGLS